ncbi:DoxX family protein [Cyanobium sp. NIES-981]|uniref:DoxX family protein n=1 Tax=Cyanobium sp. NIES-981 TaxID=1851505 RepID=UPI0007DCD8CC|nr:DoxX family protein [Cyanobium sp. NIES-981]SBO42844.1 DoxX [Cyanobium sp. NIES-981]
MASRFSWLDALGRVLLCLVFVQAALGKLSGFAAVAGKLRMVGLPVPELLLAGAVVAMGVGSALVISGWRRGLGAALLLVFLIPATLVFHTALDDPQERIQLFKNLAIMGGLLLVLDRSGPRAESDLRPRG